MTKVEKLQFIPNGIYWALGGMLGGIVVGISIAKYYGWSPLSIAFWLGFGLFVGALSGVLSFIIYRRIYDNVDLAKTIGNCE